MKRVMRKSLSWLLSVVMIFGVFALSNINKIDVNATGNITTQDIQRVLDKYGYTTGNYWTTYDYPGMYDDCSRTTQTIDSELYASSQPATSTSSGIQSYKSYNYNNAWQCHGFALYVMSKVTGVTVSGNGGTNWTKITNQPSYLQVGDIFKSNGHTAIVLTADNGRYTFAECWGSVNCKISIGKGFNYSYYTISDIINSDGFVYVLRYGGNSIPVDPYVPVIQSAYVDNVTPLSFKLISKVSDNVGVSRVEFETWKDGSPLRKNYTASYIGNDIYVYDVDISDLTNEAGVYHSIVHAYDPSNNHSTAEIYIIVPDKDLYVPVIQNAYVDNVTPYSFRLNAKVSDNTGVSRVEFETWKDGSPLRKTYTASYIGDDIYVYDVDISDLTNEVGVYHSIVHAYDTSNNHSTAEIYIIVPEDNEAPEISNVVVSQISSKGYRVTCKVNDNFGVTNIKFPTWTSLTNSPVWYDGTINGDVATFYFNVSDISNNNGEWATHIYAYDGSGNCTSNSVSHGYHYTTDEPLEITSLIYEGHEYTVYNSGKSWTDAKQWCENNGGYLACTTNEGEWNAVKGLLEKYNGVYCWLGAENNSGSWKWITGESMNYNVWGNNQPDNYSGIEHYLGTWGNWYGYIDGYVWNDYVNSPSDIGGFVMEKEIKPTDMQLSSNNLTVKEGETAVLSYSFLPENANAAVTWESENTNIATVDNGKITGVKQGQVVITAVTDNGIRKNIIVNVNKVNTINNTSVINSDKVQIGDKVRISASANGGTAPYTYAYYYKRRTNTAWKTLGTEWGTNSSVAFAPTAEASYDIKVVVKDSTGATSEKLFTVTAVKELELTNVSVVGREKIKLGSAIPMIGKAVGGAGEPYTYSFYFKRSTNTAWKLLGNKFTSTASARFKPTAKGTYDIRIDVKDSTGTIVKKFFTATVK